MIYKDNDYYKVRGSVIDLTDKSARIIVKDIGKKYWIPLHSIKIKTTEPDIDQWFMIKGWKRKRMRLNK